MQVIAQKNYSIEQKTQIINLFTSTFPGDKNFLNSFFGHIMNFHPNLTSIICKDSNSEIISTMLVLESMAKFNSENLRVCTLSFFSTKPEYRKGEPSRLVRNYLLDQIIPKFQLSIGFPRHVMQGYWSKYGFTETTNSAGIKINFMEILHTNESNFFWQNADLKDIPEIQFLYQQAIARRRLQYLRSLDTWAYLFKISEILKLRILVCRGQDSKILSYAVIQDGTIIEISHISYEDNFLLNNFFQTNSHFKVSFLSLRGMLSSNYYDLLRFFSEDQLTSLMIKEDKWDFMLNSPNQILHDHILEIETGHDFSEEVIFKKRKDNLISTFSVVDINLL